MASLGRKDKELQKKTIATMRAHWRACLAKTQQVATPPAIMTGWRWHWMRQSGSVMTMKMKEHRIVIQKIVEQRIVEMHGVVLIMI